MKAALKARLPGAGAVRQVKRAGAKVKGATAKAKTALETAKARRGAGQHPPGEPNGDLHEQNSAANAMKARWAAQGRGRHSGPGRYALAGAGDSGLTPHSHPIGKPGPMRMAGEGTEDTSILPKPTAGAFAQRTTSEAIPKDPVLRRRMLIRETAQTRANSRIPRGTSNIGKPTGGCVGVARTDIKGLQNEVFEGGSRYAGDKPPDTTFIHGDGSIGRAQSHAEQNLAGEFDRAVKEKMANGQLTPADLQGTNVYMHTELPTCDSCKWGKNTPNAPDSKLGVPMKLSKAYPDVTFTYTSDEAPNEVLVIKNGIATTP